MWLSNFCIRRPVFTIVINLVLAILGLWAARDLQVRAFPRLVLPSVTVTTAFPGADPVLVEREVTAQLEGAIGAVPGIDSMTSTSEQGLSTIQVNFVAGTDPSTVVENVRAKVSQVQPQLPSGIVSPIINQISTDGQPVLYLAFADPKESAMAVTDFVRREIMPRLATIPGVAQSQLIGERKYAIRLVLDPVRMAAHGITVSDVKNALAEQNIATPGGQVGRRNEAISVLVDTTLDNLAEFRNLVLRRGPDGYVIRLTQVGRAVVGPDQSLTAFRYGGKNAIAIGLVPQSSGNPLEISKAVRAMLPDLRRAAPSSMTIDLAFDTSVSIQASVDHVALTIVIAVGLVLAVVLFFLGSLWTSMIPLATVPLSLVGTLFFMVLLGFSINIFSLLAVVLAIGLVVDDAIVEVENVQRHVDAGMGAMDAAFLGSQEVGFAVIAMTITLASVFMPLGFAGGVAGQILREFAFTLAISILLSGFIARTLSPMMCGRLIGRKPKRAYARRIDQAIAALTEHYRRVLEVTLTRRWVVVVLTLAAVAGSVLLARQVPSSISAKEDQAYIAIKFTGPPTATLDYLSRWTARAQQVIARQPEVANTLVMLGIPLRNEATAVIVFKPWSQRRRTSSQITTSIMAGFEDLPGLAPSLYATDPLAGVGAGQPVQWLLETSGSYQDLAAAGAAVKAAARGDKALENVTVNLQMNTPKINVEVDRAAAADVGVAVGTIGATIQSLLGGQRASTFSYNGGLYNVYIELPERLRASAASLEGVFLRGRTGDLIPLRSLIRISATAGPSVLSRTDQMNSLTLGADPGPGYSVAAATAELKGVAQKVLPSNVRIVASATVRAMEQTASSIGLVMLLSLIFIYLVLSAQFESFRDPAIILVIVPLALCGATLGLYLFGGSYNLYSVVGLVTLIGLIAKHGILIVEFTNQRREEGHDLNAALLDAATVRLRPILMTTVATVLGALPLAIATGAGAGGLSQIGIVITVGMTLGTLVSLFVLPVACSLMASKTPHGIVPVPDLARIALAAQRTAAE
ncbi:MAG: efflux RND transporter permease subunit [Stellaceae bacterium]